jgi:hypothetical protein
VIFPAVPSVSDEGLWGPFRPFSTRISSHKVLYTNNLWHLARKLQFPPAIPMMAAVNEELGPCPNI